MKSGTTELLKFVKLQRRLKESKRGVVGLLECLWLATAKNCPRGDIGRFSNEEIAILCDYEGDPDELVSAMIDCRWLDVDEDCRLIVHDWAFIRRDYRGPLGRRPDLGSVRWRTIRAIVIQEDGPVCHYCNSECVDDPTVDHVIPFASGGGMDRSNLVVACRSCNSRKGCR